MIFAVLFCVCQTFCVAPFERPPFDLYLQLPDRSGILSCLLYTSGTPPLVKRIDTFALIAAIKANTPAFSKTPIDRQMPLGGIATPFQSRLANFPGKEGQIQSAGRPNKKRKQPSKILWFQLRGANQHKCKIEIRGIYLCIVPTAANQFQTAAAFAKIAAC